MGNLKRLFFMKTTNITFDIVWINKSLWNTRYTQNIFVNIPREKKPTKLTSKTLDLHWDAKLRTLRNIFESQIIFSSFIEGYVITIEIKEWMLKVKAHFRKIVSWYERYFVVFTTMWSSIKKKRKRIIRIVKKEHLGEKKVLTQFLTT
jgi:uncharacterized membrane protein